MTGASDATRHIVDELARAWNSRDGASFGRLFADDADYVTGAGLRLAGRSQIHDALFARGPDEVQTGKVRLVTESIRVLGPDAAVALCAWDMDSGDPPAERGPTGRSGFVTIVVERAREVWRIVALQNTDRSS